MKEGGKHTPGPWSFEGPSHSIIVWAGEDSRVCFMTSDGPAEANARLIAAAPALLEALKATRNALVVAVRASVDIEGFDPAEHVLVKRADEAIRQATGGENGR